ncbi:MAG: hypothetical protein KDC34_19165 [Saprospiraceae bacterium]|nr:hypothetical protein [Saprospiraceae bacterium]
MMDKHFIRSLPHKITDLLQHGSIKNLSDQSGLSRISIKQILDGHWTNEEVVKAAFEMLHKDNEKVQQILAFAKYDIVGNTSD